MKSQQDLFHSLPQLNQLTLGKAKALRKYKVGNQSVKIKLGRKNCGSSPERWLQRSERVFITFGSISSMLLKMHQRTKNLRKIKIYRSQVKSCLILWFSTEQKILIIQVYLRLFTKSQSILHKNWRLKLFKLHCRIQYPLESRYFSKKCISQRKQNFKQMLYLVSVLTTQGN